MGTLEREGIVASHALSFLEALGPNGTLAMVQLRGRVYISSGAILGVDKLLATRRNPVDNKVELLATRYAYNAWMPDDNERELFRYDNCYGDVATLHRHRFYKDGRQHGIEAVAYPDLPRLDGVIREAEHLSRI